MTYVHRVLHEQYATFFFPSCEGAGCGAGHQDLYKLPVLPSLDDGGGNGEVVVRTWTITSVYGNNGPLEITVQAKVRVGPPVVVVVPLARLDGFPRKRCHLVSCKPPRYTMVLPPRVLDWKARHLGLTKYPFRVATVRTMVTEGLITVLLSSILYCKPADLVFTFCLFRQRTYCLYNKQAGGVSEHLHSDLKPGAVVRVTVGGDFTLTDCLGTPPDSGSKVLLLSAGIGVTPMIAALRWLRQRRAERLSSDGNNRQAYHFLSSAPCSGLTLPCTQPSAPCLAC